MDVQEVKNQIEAVGATLRARREQLRAEVESTQKRLRLGQCGPAEVATVLSKCRKLSEAFRLWERAARKFHNFLGEEILTETKPGPGTVYH